jgi:hypothetical protein
MPANADDTLLPFSLPSICRKKVTAAFGGEARVRVRAERTAAYTEVVKDGNWGGPLVQVVKPNAVRRENPAIFPRCRRHDG